MPKKTKSSRGTATKSRKSSALKTLPVDKAAARGVRGGKRTVVKDSHDKYANIEVSY